MKEGIASNKGDDILHIYNSSLGRISGNFYRRGDASFDDIIQYHMMEHALTGRSKYVVKELKLGLSVHFSLTLTFPPATPYCLLLSILILYCVTFKTICSAQMCYYYRPDYMSVRIFESRSYLFVLVRSYLFRSNIQLYFRPRVEGVTRNGKEKKENKRIK